MFRFFLKTTVVTTGNSYYGFFQDFFIINRDKQTFSYICGSFFPQVTHSHYLKSYLRNRCWETGLQLQSSLQRRYNMNGRSQIQGGKNWILPKEMNANRFFWDSHWLKIWPNHFFPSMGPNGGSVAMDSVRINILVAIFGCAEPTKSWSNW